MNGFGVRRSRRLLDVAVVASALVVLVSVVNVARAVTSSADLSSAAPKTDPDLVDRCGADVILVADATLAPGLAVAAGRQLAGAVSGTGSRLGLVVAVDLAQPIGDGLADVTAESSLPGGAVDQLLAGLAATLPSGARNWSAGLEQAAEVALADAGGRPLLVLYLTDGPTPDLASAVSVAGELRQRPGTHLTFVGTGAAAGLGIELSTVAGPDVLVHGSRAVDVARDDVVLVADPARLGAALQELGTGLCATNLSVHAMDASTGAPVHRAGVGLTLATAAGAPAASIAPAGDSQVTGAAGLASWTLALAPGTTTTLALGNPGAPASTRSLTCLGADTVRAYGNGAQLVIDGVPAGADIVCQLRLLDESRPLRIRMVPFPGDVACPQDLAGLTALTAAPLGSPVTYCLELVNEGKRSAIGVQLEVPGLDQSGPAWVVETEFPPSARSRQRYVTTLQAPGAVEATATAPGMLPAQAGAFVGTAPPMLTVEKLVAGDPACGEPTETPRGCYRLLNTGGTWLDQLNLTPTWMPVPLSLERRIAPGEAVVIGVPEAPPGAPDARVDLPADTAAEAAPDAAGEVAAAAGEVGAGEPEPREGIPAAALDALATARAVDAAGNPLPDVAPVSTAAVPGAPFVLDTLVSDELVAPGDTVDFGVTVSNPAGGASYTAVSMTDTACSAPGTSTELSGNGNGDLEGGETWLFACSAPVETEVLSMATVLAQDQTGTTVAQSDPRNRPPVVQAPNLRIKKSQVNDLVPGSSTVYELKVQNTGRFVAPNVLVTDPLPAGLTFLGAESDIGACAQAGGVVACSLGTLAPQENTESFVVRITVEAQPSLTGTVVRNEANVSSDAADVDVSDNTSAVRSQVGACVRDCPALIATGGDNSGGGGGSGGGGSDTNVDGEQLARTGVDNLALSGWGFILVASGLSFLASARRRWAFLA